MLKELGVEPLAGETLTQFPLGAAVQERVSLVDILVGVTLIQGGDTLSWLVLYVKDKESGKPPRVGWQLLPV